MRLKVINPYDHKVYHETAFDRPQDRDRKMQRAVEAFQSWRRVSLAERAAIIRQGLDYFDRHRETIAAEITGQMGKPIIDVGLELAARLEVGTVYQNLRESGYAPRIRQRMRDFIAGHASYP